MDFGSLVAGATTLAVETAELHVTYACNYIGLPSGRPKVPFSL